MVAIDYLAVDPLPGVEIIQLDFTDPRRRTKLKSHAARRRRRRRAVGHGGADVGHTDTDHLRIMGLAETAAYFACDVLAPGGAFLCKVFQGGTERACSIC